MRSFVALALLVPLLASPSAFAKFVTLPLKKFQRSGVYGSSHADRVCAMLLQECDRNGPTSTPATNSGYSYTTQVGIGSPPTYYNLLVDTGSSNTFCGTGTRYVRTPTSLATGEGIAIGYGSGSVSLIEYLDQVTVAPGLVITNQSIGDAVLYAGFNGIDGILGVGPVDLAQGTLSSNVIPTVMDNLKSQKHIDKEVLGVLFAPATSSKDQNGALTYGGINSSMYEGEVIYTPVTDVPLSSRFWGINVTLCTYGKEKVIPTVTAGIVDTGTTLILIADDFFETYRNAIPGAEINHTIGLLEIPESAVASMRPLHFKIADHVFSLDVHAQLFPKDQNTVLGGQVGKRYGVIWKLGGMSGSGSDFVLGLKFLERYFSVFDTDNKRVGFARTRHTFTTHED